MSKKNCNLSDLNLLSFKGTELADRSAPLAEVGISEIGSSTEAVVDSINIASFAWGKDNLDKMKPIFEAEFRCVTHPKGEVEVHRVFMQWDSQYKYGWKDGRDFITVGVMLTESGQWIRMPPSTYDVDTIFSTFGYNGMETLYEDEAISNTVPGRLEFPVILPKAVWSDPGSGVRMVVNKVIYWDGNDAPREERKE